MNSLRYARLGADVTVVELARASGVHRATIHSIETWRHTPTVATLDRLAAALSLLSGTLVRLDVEGLPANRGGFSEDRRARRTDPAGAAHSRKRRRASEV